jgi:hypothetical protein
MIITTLEGFIVYTPEEFVMQLQNIAVLSNFPNFLFWSGCLWQATANTHLLRHADHCGFLSTFVQGLIA